MIDTALGKRSRIKGLAGRRACQIVFYHNAPHFDESTYAVEGKNRGWEYSCWDENRRSES